MAFHDCCYTELDENLAHPMLQLVGIGNQLPLRKMYEAEREAMK